MAKLIGEDQPSHGNLSTLTKVDKLRELIGTRIALPQVVVVGDQSSGKSSVLENLTGFAFPRAAELCTRYATQITCRREPEESISVSIMANHDAPANERERLQGFHRTYTELSPLNLARLFKDANDTMGISNGDNGFSTDGFPLPAFSEHILKIEKVGPNEEHFTVIDVPGIFRNETEGVTTENDISLVMNMVNRYMRDDRTIILAIIPSNVDPATQEILKLAKKVDSTMTRTMAVLTKPDLAIERTTQQIAIDHVLGKRGELTLGYYVVKNRGPDDADKTLEQGQRDELEFFNKAPWSALAYTGRAGISCLKQRVRELLIDLIKKEFPKLKADVVKELGTVRALHEEMGPSRNDQQTQRAYLNKISEAFQSRVRDARSANYTSDKIFAERHDIRLVTRIVEASEHYANEMMTKGHTRAFVKNEGIGTEEERELFQLFKLFEDEEDDFDATSEITKALRQYPELEQVFDVSETYSTPAGAGRIMDYIEEVYKSSRGQELVTFGGNLVGTLFKEQSKNWERITLEYMSVSIYHVHHFISVMVKSVCPDPRVYEELWNGYLLEELMKSYQRAMDRAKFLLEVEREGTPLTLSPGFAGQLSKTQGERLVQKVKNLGILISSYPVASPSSWISIDPSRLRDLAANGANVAQVRESMHDVLASYYELARTRLVDIVYQQAVNHDLLMTGGGGGGNTGPLGILSTEMVLGLSEDQLDMIAAEDAPVKQRREKLLRDIRNFEEALKVLKGTR